MRRRRFDQKGAGRPDFAAQREALDQPEEHHQQRRGDADSGIGGGECQPDDRCAHQPEAEQHRGLAPPRIAHRADEKSAQRPGQKPHPKGRQ